MKRKRNMDCLTGKEGFWRKTTRAAYLAGCLGMIALTVPAQAAGEEQPHKAVTACSENEYIIGTVDDGDNRVYDGEGNYITRFSGYMENFTLLRVTRDRVTFYQKDDVYEVFSFAVPGVILTFPVDDYIVRTIRGYTVAVSRADGTFTCYDRYGNAVVRSETPVVPMEGRWCYDVDAIFLDNNMLITVKGLDDSASMLLLRGVSAIPEQEEGDVEAWQIQSSEIADAMASYNLSGFGDFFLIEDRTGKNGKIYTLTGELIMDQVTGIRGYSYRMWDYSDAYGWTRDSFALHNVGDGYEVFNTQLEYLGRIPYTDKTYNLTNGEYVVGLAYDALDSRICEGFVSDADGTSWGYARTEEGYVLGRGGETIYISAAPEENLDSFNDAYVVVSRDVLGEPNVTVRMRDTGEVFRPFEQARGLSAEVLLGSSGLLMNVPSRYVVKGMEEDTYHRSYFLYDNTGALSYASTKAFIYQWAGDCWYCRRGIYKGLIDVNGNWIVKLTGKEE